MKHRLFSLLAGFLLCGSLLSVQPLRAQLIHAYGRPSQSLNGEWHIIIDPYDRGRHDMWKNRKPQSPLEFREYSFDEGLTLQVPGDFNSQLPELKYYEGTVWYGRYFDLPEPQPGERLLLYFAGVANTADVYLNAQPVGHHEGGFTPFAFDVTEWLRTKENFLAVAVDNRRRPDAIPAMNFDWWNYGGITRDVLLIRVPELHIADYFIRLDPTDPACLCFDVALSQPAAGTPVTVAIPELKLEQTLTADADGRVMGSFTPRKLVRWDIDNPKLYEVTFSAGHDSVTEHIGFRTIATRGNEILLNDRPIFLCGVSIHEEVPQRKGRAYSEADAAMLLSEAKALGANFIRLAHYPQNEHMVRLAERMGFLLWEEIPVWQGIDFANEATQEKAVRMMHEMIGRDKNRAAIALWGIANETRPSEARNRFLSELKSVVHSLDDTRLVSAAFDNSTYNAATNCYEINDDPVVELVDVVGVNKYVGWYDNWRTDPAKTGWRVAIGKPLVFSEFGGEALYGRHGNGEAKWSWSEEYQAQLYRDNIKMFENIPNLSGVCPWILFDFRSPTRFSPLQGLEFNRKGLVSDRGERKEAWYIMRDYYAKMKR